MSLQKEFLAFIKKNAISQNAAGQAIGYTGPVISQWVSETYNGDVKKVEQAITLWMEREKKRREVKGVPLVETDVFNRITYAIGVVHEERDIGVIVGPAGVGKTTTFLHYRENNQGSCIYVEADSSSSKNSLMQSIARELALDVNGDFSSLVRRIAEYLVGHDVLVIVDQADYLNDKTLEILRQIIHDKGKSGLLLAGLGRLEYRLKNIKNDHQQLLSRIGVFVKVESLKTADAENIVKSVWPELDSPTTTALVKASDCSTRRLIKLIDRSHRIAVANGKNMPDAQVVSLAGTLILK